MFEINEEELPERNGLADTSVDAEGLPDDEPEETPADRQNWEDEENLIPANA